MYFLAFGLNTERYLVSLHIQSECGKIRTRKTPNMDTFYAVKAAQVELKATQVRGWPDLSSEGIWHKATVLSACKNLYLYNIAIL